MFQQPFGPAPVYYIAEQTKKPVWLGEVGRDGLLNLILPGAEI